MFPPIAALSKPQSGACFARQLPHGCPGEALVGRACEHGFDPRGIGPRLIPKRREARNALAKGGLGRVERTGFNGVVEALEAVVGLGRTMV
ncbi:hypothetical protein [Stappia sp. ICDLI1TA098]